MNDLEWTIATAADYCGLELTEAQAREVLEDPKVRESLICGGRDTVSREMVANSLAMRIVGTRWPTYAQGGFDVFMAGLQARAHDLGYKMAP